jgi:hypothetical protein
MSASRITITVDDEVLRTIRERVGPGEVSAYVVEALRTRLRVDPIEEMLERLDAIHGPLSVSEKEAGEQWLHEISQRLSSTPEPSLASLEETANSGHD